LALKQLYITENGPAFGNFKPSFLDCGRNKVNDILDRKLTGHAPPVPSGSMRMVSTSRRRKNANNYRNSRPRTAFSHRLLTGANSATAMFAGCSPGGASSSNSSRCRDAGRPSL